MAPVARRALLICATPAGLEEIEKAKPIIRRVNEAIKTGFSEHEIYVLKRVLADISEFKGM